MGNFVYRNIFEAFIKKFFQWQKMSHNLIMYVNKRFNLRKIDILGKILFCFEKLFLQNFDATIS